MCKPKRICVLFINKWKSLGFETEFGRAFFTVTPHCAAGVFSRLYALFNTTTG